MGELATTLHHLHLASEPLRAVVPREGEDAATNRYGSQRATTFVTTPPTDPFEEVVKTVSDALAAGATDRDIRNAFYLAVRKWQEQQAETEQHPPEHWGCLALSVIVTGAQVAHDPRMMSGGSLADQADERKLKEEVVRLKSLMEEPAAFEARVHQIERRIDYRFSGVESEVAAVAFEWYRRHFQEIPLLADNILDEITELEQNDPVAVPVFWTVRRLNHAA